MLDRRLGALLLCLSAITLPALAQTAQPEAAKRPEFEVATVKPAGSGVRYTALYTYPGGRIVVTHFNLALLVQHAFNVQSYQVTGGPRWVQEDEFDITAQPPAASAAGHVNPPSPKFPMNEEQRAMLQALLIQRFGLKFHIEDREGPVYVLTRGTKDLALMPHAHPDDFPFLGDVVHQGDVVNGEMNGHNISMPLFAFKLSSFLEWPVLDQTGLTGSYDIHLKSIDPENTDLVGGIVNCVERLGLKLKGARGPVHTIVIDAASHPTEN